MSQTSSTPYRFGDLLALVRERWVRQMIEHVAAAGYPDYRRSDAALVRMLARGSRSIGQIGAGLGISRQAARKLVTGLERRSYARTVKDRGDARQLDVGLTAHGEAFARAIADAMEALDRRVAEQLEPTQLLAADRALRATLPDQDARDHAARLVPPPET